MRGGKLSKAEKAAKYDSVKAQLERYELVVFDIACGKQPDAVASESETDPISETDGCSVTLNVEAKLYRVLGGEAGLVVLRTWTSYGDGSKDSCSEVRLARLDDLNELAGGEHYFESAWGRAIARIASTLRSARKRAYDSHFESVPTYTTG